jgi:hypothetical protein
MPSHFEEPPDPAVTSESLMAEAGVLAARLRMLREDLATVDERIGAVSAALRALGQQVDLWPGTGDAAAGTGDPGGSEGSEGS